MIPIEAAELFIGQHFPDCILAILGGSASQNKHNSHSDLDIVIVESNENDFNRKVFSLFGWMIECTVLTPENYRDLFDDGIRAANPALQRIIAEGTILKQSGHGLMIYQEAKDDLAYGPMPWTSSELDYARYMISDNVMDLQGADNRTERWFVVNKIVTLLSEFILRSNNLWVGEGKHLYKNVAAFSPAIAARLDNTLESLYTKENINDLISLCCEILEPYGGILIEGYEE